MKATNMLLDIIMPKKQLSKLAICARAIVAYRRKHLSIEMRVSTKLTRCPTSSLLDTDAVNRRLTSHTLYKSSSEQEDN